MEAVGCSGSLIMFLTILMFPLLFLGTQTEVEQPPSALKTPTPTVTGADTDRRVIKVKIVEEDSILNFDPDQR